MGMWRQILQILASTEREHQRIRAENSTSNRVQRAVAKHRTASQELEQTIRELLAENDRLRQGGGGDRAPQS
jgi:hypothetical protein